MDQVGFEFTRDSIEMSDVSARNKIQAQALQAAINAEASIALKPEIQPPMPKPFVLPRPEYQKLKYQFHLDHNHQSHHTFCFFHVMK